LIKKYLIWRGEGVITMKNNNILVLKITGKLFDAEVELLKKYVEIIRDLVIKYRIAIICGGGGIARKYIELARSIGIDSNYWLDIIGINASRLNSYLLISSLQPHAYPKPVESLLEAQKAISNYKIIVAGGLIPGQSTASVALEVAEALDVDRVIMFSAVDRVYDKDPGKYPDAKPFSKINISKLREILRGKQVPGEYALIDLRALDIAERSNIVINIIHYKSPEKIYEVLRGGNPGTIIHP
jgi:uridylate kinase